MLAWQPCRPTAQPLDGCSHCPSERSFIFSQSNFFVLSLWIWFWHPLFSCVSNYNKMMFLFSFNLNMKHSKGFAGSLANVDVLECCTHAWSSICIEVDNTWLTSLVSFPLYDLRMEINLKDVFFFYSILEFLSTVTERREKLNDSEDSEVCLCHPGVAHMLTQLKHPCIYAHKLLIEHDTWAHTYQKHAHIHTNTHTYIHTRTRTCSNTHVHAHARTHTHTHTHALKHTRAHTHTHTHTHTHIHTNTNIHIYTLMHQISSFLNAFNLIKKKLSQCINSRGFHHMYTFSDRISWPSTSLRHLKHK